MICVPEASFWVPFGRVAVVPEFGSSVTFPAIVGKSLANEMLLFARKLTSAEALAAGLVSRCVARAELAATVERCALALLDCPLGMESAVLFKRVMTNASDLDAIERVIRSELDILDERIARGDILTAAMQSLSSAGKGASAKAKL